jgi:hypothetical protein
MSPLKFGKKPARKYAMKLPFGRRRARTRALAVSGQFTPSAQVLAMIKRRQMFAVAGGYSGSLWPS